MAVSDGKIIERDTALSFHEKRQEMIDHQLIDMAEYCRRQAHHYGKLN